MRAGERAFFVAAGTTYYVLAIDDQSDGGGNGGSLSISFNEVLSPTLDIITVRGMVVIGKLLSWALYGVWQPYNAPGAALWRA